MLLVFLDNINLDLRLGYKETMIISTVIYIHFRRYFPITCKFWFINVNAEFRLHMFFQLWFYKWNIKCSDHWFRGFKRNKEGRRFEQRNEFTFRLISKLSLILKKCQIIGAREILENRAGEIGMCTARSSISHLKLSAYIDVFTFPAKPPDDSNLWTQW